MFGHIFENCLDDEIAALERFLAVLAEEQRVLGAPPLDVNAFTRVTEDKNRQAAELERLEQQRRIVVADHGYGPDQGYGPDRDGGAALAAAIDCTPLWNRFLRRTAAARDANQANGTAVDERLSHNQKELAFLQRHAGQTFYGPSGEKHSPSGGRRFDAGA